MPIRSIILLSMLAGILNGCADQMILHPSRKPIVDTSARPIEIAGPNGKLEVWVAPARGAIGHEPRAFVLTFTGNASRAEWDAEIVADLWGDRPVEVWALNYPGYGKSEGPAKLARFGPAALAAFDALTARAAGRPIIVGGRSIGTAVALYVAAHRPVAGVMLHSPVPLQTLIMGRFGWWNLWLGAAFVCAGIPADLDAVANAKQVKAPGVFIITGADSLVPVPYQQKIVDAYAGAKDVIVIPSCDHNDSVPESAMGRVHGGMDSLLKRGALQG